MLTNCALEDELRQRDAQRNALAESGGSTGYSTYESDREIEDLEARTETLQQEAKADKRKICDLNEELILSEQRDQDRAVSLLRALNG